MIANRPPDQIRLATWTAVLLQLVHMVYAAINLLHYRFRFAELPFEVALSPFYITTLALPAVVLWVVYGFLTRTAVVTARSPVTYAALLVAITAGLCVVIYTMIAMYAAVYVVLHAPH